MSKQKPTEELVKQFSSEPGVESEDLDFKSKEIIESSSGRVKLIKVLSAMANQQGGTVIIGVRKEDDSLLVQNFSIDSETLQYLTHTATEYTKPNIATLWEARFVEYSGKRILRIDVGQATDDLVLFKDSGDYTPWIRVEDGMEEMTKVQMQEFYDRRRRREAREYFSSHVEQRNPVTMDISNGGRALNFDGPTNRVITTTGRTSLVVFGRGNIMGNNGRSLLYHLETYFDAQTPDDIGETLELAQKHTNAQIGQREFGYTVQLGDRQLLGRGRENLISDLKNIGQTISILINAHKKGPKSEHALSGANRPIVVGFTNCKYGLFWIESQWRGNGYMRNRCGFILNDIPFDDSPFKSFYSEIGTEPSTYEQQHGVQVATL